MAVIDKTEISTVKQTILIFFLIIFFSSFTTQSKRTLLENFKIGKFSYSIYKEEKYLHDDDMNADFFVIYGKNKKNNLCSSFMSANRDNGQVIKGRYSYNQKRLEFREYYFNTKSGPDSMIKYFYPNRMGDLILTKYVEFKNGIGTGK